MKSLDSYRTTEMTQKVHIGKHLRECKVGKGFLGKAYKVQTFSKKNWNSASNLKDLYEEEYHNRVKEQAIDKEIT